MKKFIFCLVFCMFYGMGYAEWIDVNKLYCLEDENNSVCLEISQLPFGPGIEGEVYLIDETYVDGKLVSKNWSPFGYVSQPRENSFIEFSYLPGWYGKMERGQLIMFQNFIKFKTR